METVNIKFPDSAKMKGQESYNGIQFAFAEKLKAGKYEQTTGWTSCREGTCSQAKRVITGKWKEPSPYSSCSGKIDYDTVRLLVYFKKTASKKVDKAERDGRIKRYIKCALKILNFFEGMGHLKLSKAYATKHDLPNSNIVYLFEGSGEWMRTPHLVSLYALLIRCGKFEEFESKMKNYKDFLKRVKAISGDYNANCHGAGSRFRNWPFTHSNDVIYLCKIGPKMQVLMEQRKRIFSKKKKKDHYEKAADSTDGIAQLVYGAVDDKETQKKFVASCDKYEIKAITK